MSGAELRGRAGYLACWQGVERVRARRRRCAEMSGVDAPRGVGAAGRKPAQAASPAPCTHTSALLGPGRAGRNGRVASWQVPGASGLLSVAGTAGRAGRGGLGAGVGTSSIASSATPSWSVHAPAHTRARARALCVHDRRRRARLAGKARGATWRRGASDLYRLFPQSYRIFRGGGGLNPIS